MEELDRTLVTSFVLTLVIFIITFLTVLIGLSKYLSQ